MRARRLLPLCGVIALVGCAASESLPTEDDRCVLRAWYASDRTLARTDLTLTPAAAEHPELIGSFSNFARPGLREFDIRTAPTGEVWDTIGIPLAAGNYLYGFVVGNYLLTDDIEPQSAFAPDPRFLDSGPYDAEFSLTSIPDCSAPTLQVTEATSSTDGSIRFVAEFHGWASGGDLDSSSVNVVLQQAGAPLPAPTWELIGNASDGGQQIVATASGLSPGKYTVNFSARGLDKQVPPDASASVFVETPTAVLGAVGLQAPRPLDDVVIYQIMIDRFRGNNGALPPPATPGLRAGGSFAGVLQAVQAGYFQRLGVTTLWLSPIYQNPPGLYMGLDGHEYEAYHGYWPTEPRSVEPNFGADTDLQALVAAAHARGLRILFDAVPNQIFQDHPYYLQHSRQVPALALAKDAAAQSWFNDGPDACVCGTDGCSWSDSIETCWFDWYLPDLNWRQPDMMQAGVDDLLWWQKSFDLDGMRIDAVPMMPRAATRRIDRATRQASFRQGIDLLIVGEDYTGPGDAGRTDIRSFLGQSYDGLDSAFDFPLMWATRSVLAQDQNGLDELEQEIASSNAAWAGSGAVMAHILDNHDTPRFISVATGEDGNDPWLNPPAQPSPSDAEPYLRQVLGLALIFTLPGIPVLYYGDEIGLAGANDPDSRRVLPDVLAPASGPSSTLSTAEAAVLATTARLGQLRACLTALRRGTRTVLVDGPDLTVALHQLSAGDTGGAATSDSPVVVILSRARTAEQVVVSGVPAGRYIDALSASGSLTPLLSSLSPTAGTTSNKPLVVDTDIAAVTVAPLRPAIYVLDGSPCLSD
jgi:glycosidase